jgi:uncharacterized protein (DUF169 family)
MISREVWDKFARAVADGFAVASPGDRTAAKDLLAAFPIKHGGKTYQAFFYAVLIDCDSVPDAGSIVKQLESALRIVLEQEAARSGRRIVWDEILRGRDDPLE